MKIQQQNTISISRACKTLGVSRNGYSLWLRRQPCDKDLDLRARIQEIAVSHVRYGYRRITAELKNQGFTVNHKRVLRLMRADNLLCSRKVFKPQTTNSNHGLRVTDVNQLWVADITDIRLRREFVYLGAILDKYSRRCVGWGLSRYIDTQLALDAFNKALDAPKKQTSTA